MGEEHIISLLTQEKFYEFIELSQCFCGGHLVFHDLHHQFYLNPYMFFQAGKEQFANEIGVRLVKAIGGTIDFLLTPDPEYSEAAEIGPKLSKYFSPHPKIITLQYRKVFPNSNAATPYVISEHHYQDLEGKSVLFIDSGTVTGESATSVRDGLIRAHSGPIHIFTFFHRKDIHWAKNLTGISDRGITVKYYYLGQLFLPVWRARDCPWEAEAEYWRSRRQKFHSQRAQSIIGENIVSLQPIPTRAVDWGTDIQHKNTAPGRSIQLQLSAFSTPGVLRNSETFWKLRAVNEYFRSLSLSETIIGGIPPHTAKALKLKGALAIVAAVENAISHRDALTGIADTTEQRIIAACRVVISEQGSHQRDKWIALIIMRTFLGEDFVDEIPGLLHKAQSDQSLYLGLVDNIHSFIEEMPVTTELIREAFDIARHRLDREFNIPAPGWIANDEFRRRATVLYDLRQDQYSLLPVGRKEYSLSRILLPLRAYIAESKPQHIPAAKRINDILTIILEYELDIGEAKNKAPNKTTLPVRLIYNLERWRDDVLTPLQTIYSLLKGLFEFPFVVVPSYLSEATSPNMFSDIDIANSSVERLQNWEPKGFEDALSRLRESLSRLFMNTFEDESIVGDLVRAWFVDIRKEIERYRTAYEDLLRERGIELRIEWKTNAKNVLWYRDYMQHALDNFFIDTLKEDGGPFPRKFEGVKIVFIQITTNQEQEKVQIIWEDTGVGITDQRIRAIENLGGDGTLRKIKRRLRRVGGDLYVEQRLGGGTRFKIDLIGVDL